MNEELFPERLTVSFDANRVAFGRHETFAPRYSWLPKGFQALLKDQKIFESEHSTVSLGVGKNMVTAIRYWLRAARMVSAQSAEPTNLGRFVLDPSSGRDPYLEDEATIWLLHWLIASNPSIATSWWWFFNRFHRQEFTSQELSTALADFTKDSLPSKKRPATATVKNDAQLIHRMYAQSKGIGRTPMEEALDSPFALLNLVSQSSGGRVFRSCSAARHSLPICVLTFAVCQVIDAQEGTNFIPIEELMHAKGNLSAPGSVFRLTENALITNLEKMCERWPEEFTLRESGGIHQINREGKVAPIDFLAAHYDSILEGLVA